MLYEQAEDRRKLPVIDLRKIGEEPAFDVETTELRMVIKTPDTSVRRFAFQSEPVLLKSETRRLRRSGTRLVYPNDHEWLLNLFESSHQAISAACSINDDLVMRGEYDSEKAVGMGVEPIGVRYRNARGKRFEQKFCLMDEGPDFLIFAPLHSLVRHDSEAD